MNPRDTQDARAFAAVIAKMQKDIEDLQTTSRLARSSIEDGAVNAYDAQGVLRLQIGKQFDGVYGASALASGAPPPVPSVPVLEAVPGGVTVTWGGTFPNANPPMDFKQVDVVVSTISNADFIGIPPAQSIVSPRGGRVTLFFPDTATRYFALITRNQSGRASAVSAVAGVAPLAFDSGISDTGWYEPTLLNGYRNYGEPWETVGLRKIGQVVHARGLMALESADRTTGTIIFSMPPEYRVELNQDTHQPVIVDNQPGARVNVTDDGRFAVNNNFGANGPGWLSIAGLTWVAAV